MWQDDTHINRQPEAHHAASRREEKVTLFRHHNCETGGERSRERELSNAT